MNYWAKIINQKKEIPALKKGVFASCYSDRMTGGGLHVPFKRDSLGRYVRKLRLKLEEF